jgi:SAM-dependent methyltransferase
MTALSDRARAVLRRRHDDPSGRARHTETALNAEQSVRPTDSVDLEESFRGFCAVCGCYETFVRGERSIREGYRCPACKAHLRYQGQALALLERYGAPGTTSLAELVTQPSFQNLDVYEPGALGPFRSYFSGLPGYTTSEFEPGTQIGDPMGTGTCQDLMALTYDDKSFDVVVTSDVFEHVRKPYVGFSEVYRVLRPGGAHIFSIPAQYPLASRTVPRVDVSTDEDVMLLEPRYHRHHLVYNDFGADITESLAAIGFATQIPRFRCGSPHASRLATFVSVKPG